MYIYIGMNFCFSTLSAALLPVCRYDFVFIYTYIWSNMYICIYMYIYIYIYIYTCIRMFLCRYIDLHMHLYIYIYIYVWVDLNILWYDTIISVFIQIICRLISIFMSLGSSIPLVGSQSLPLMSICIWLSIWWALTLPRLDKRQFITIHKLICLLSSFSWHTLFSSYVYMCLTLCLIGIDPPTNEQTYRYMSFIIIQLAHTLFRLETALKDFFQLREMKVPLGYIHYHLCIYRYACIFIYIYIYIYINMYI
jgi:hypothetical protein